MSSSWIMMRTGVLVGLVLAVGLAGCLGGDSGTDPDSKDVETSGLPTDVLTTAPPRTTTKNPISTTKPPVSTPPGPSAAPPDQYAPVLSNSLIDSRDVTSRGATIVWTVEDDGVPSSWVQYSPDANLVIADAAENTTLIRGAGPKEVRLEGLNAQQTYYYRVCARDDVGHRAPCSELRTFTTNVAAGESSAPAVSQVQVTDITANSAVVTWNVADATGSVRSRVEYSNDPLNGFVSMDELTGPGGKQFALNNLKPQTKYLLRVFAANRLEEVHRSPSPPLEFTTPAKPDTKPPTLLWQEVSYLDFSKAEIYWESDDDSPLTLSRVDYLPAAAPPGSDWVTGSSLSAPTPGFFYYTFFGLQPQTEYKYRIWLSDKTNEVFIDGNVTFTTLAEPLGYIEEQTVTQRRITATRFNITYFVQGPATMKSWIEYGVTTKYGNKKTPVGPAEFGPGAKQVQLDQLYSATLYHFRVVTETRSGFTNGTDHQQWTAQFQQVRTNSAGFNVATIDTSFLRPLDVQYINDDPTTTHRWAVYGQAIDTGMIEPGKPPYSFPQSLQMQPGNYRYYCSQPGHTENGILRVFPPRSQDVVKNIPGTLSVGSPMWTNANNVLPAKYTCDGENVSPPITFINVPSRTKSLVVMVEDADRSTGGLTLDTQPGTNWIHWTVWNIPPTVRSFEEAIDVVTAHNARQGRNSFGNIGYDGPCLPPGETHRFQVKVFAVDLESINLPEGAGSEELVKAMDGHLVSWGKSDVFYTGT